MVIIHEIGHVIAIYFIGGKVEKFEISWSFIRGKFIFPEKITYFKHLFFTANGIIMQLSFSFIVIYFANDPSWVSLGFFYLCIIAINLVPLSITDGAYIFKAYPSIIIKCILWILVGILFVLSTQGLFILWKKQFADFHIQLVLYSIYFLMLMMSVRRILYLNLEENTNG